MSETDLRVFNAEYMRNLVITKKSRESSLKKSSASEVITSQSEINDIIKAWYGKNKGLKCACTEREFKQIVSVFIEAWHKTIEEASNMKNLRIVQGGQSGGALNLLKLLDIMAILCFITALLYSAMQPTVEYITDANLTVLNDQEQLGANLTRYLNLTLPPVPPVSSMDVYDSRNHEPVIVAFAQKYMAETLSIKRTTIFEGCQQPVSFMDKVIDFKTVLDLIPSQTLKQYTAANKRKADEEKYALEHACYSAGIDALEPELQAQMLQLVNARRRGLTQAKKQIDDQLEVNLMNNMAMTLVLAYLGTRFALSKLGRGRETNRAMVASTMRNNYLMLTQGNDGIEDISPDERPLRILGPMPVTVQNRAGIEDISPEPVGPSRRLQLAIRANALTGSPPPPPSPRQRSRSGRPALLSQEELYRRSLTTRGGRTRKTYGKRNKPNKRKTLRKLGKHTKRKTHSKRK